MSLTSRFQRLGDLSATAIEQRGVGIIVTERSEARKRYRTRLAVDCESFRVEADPGKRAGRAQTGLQPARDFSGEPLVPQRPAQALGG